MNRPKFGQILPLIHPDIKEITLYIVSEKSCVALYYKGTPLYLLNHQEYKYWKEMEVVFIGNYDSMEIQLEAK